MAEALMRHFTMLSLIPARPGKIAARDLHARLLSQGFAIDVRSVERDLHKLSLQFPLVSDAGKPAGWSWASRGNPISFPGMDAGTAMTYELLSRYLEPILPRGLLKQLQPQFDVARRVLRDFSRVPISRWSRRIAILPFGQPLVPPDLKAEVVDIVYDALLNERRFEANYRSANDGRPKRYVFNPLGLVYQEHAVYLVATLWNYEDARHFALHRMSKPAASEVAATTPAAFDFERYLCEQRSFEFPIGKDIRLELRVKDWLARHLSERRLSVDQIITPDRDGKSFRVAATTAETEQLFWWLSSHGTSVEVLKPAALRRKFVRQAEGLRAIYRRNGKAPIAE